VVIAIPDDYQGVIPKLMKSLFDAETTEAMQQLCDETCEAMQLARKSPDLDDLSARLLGQARERGEVPDDPLGERLAREEFESRLRELRKLVEEEIRRRLGEARSPLPEPTVAGGTPARFFAALREALPDDAVVTADSVAMRVWPMPCVPRKVPSPYCSDTRVASPRSLISSSALPKERTSAPSICSISWASWRVSPE